MSSDFKGARRKTGPDHQYDSTLEEALKNARLAVLPGSVPFWGAQLLNASVNECWSWKERMFFQKGKGDTCRALTDDDGGGGVAGRSVTGVRWECKGDRCAPNLNVNTLDPHHLFQKVQPVGLPIRRCAHSFTSDSGHTLADVRSKRQSLRCSSSRAAESRRLEATLCFPVLSLGAFMSIHVLQRALAAAL